MNTDDPSSTIFDCDASKTCRCCLGKKNLQSIYTKCTNDKLTWSFSEMYFICTDIYIDKEENLPNQICDDCIIQLRQYYYFRLQCSESISKFKQMTGLYQKTQRTNITKINLEKLEIQEKVSEDFKNDNNLETNQKLLDSNESDLQIDTQGDLILELASERQENLENDDSDFVLNKLEKIFAGEFDEALTPKVEINANENDDDKIRKFRCKLCGARFKQIQNLRKHSSKKHNTSEYKYKCDTCGAGFQQETALVRHVNAHKNNLLFYQCKDCNEKFKTWDKMRIHRRKMHGLAIDGSNVPILKCEYCGKTFKILNSLKQHCLRHGERKYLCTDCGMSFHQKKDLERHSVRHTGEKQYKCNQCPRAFLYKTSLAAHKLGHAGERSHQCHVCEKRFIHKSDMRSHLRLHDGVKHVCIVCNKTYTRVDNLRVHMKSHGEMTHFCQICSKGFYDAGYLKKHEKSHFKRNF